MNKNFMSRQQEYESLRKSKQELVEKTMYNKYTYKPQISKQMGSLAAKKQMGEIKQMVQDIERRGQEEERLAREEQEQEGYPFRTDPQRTASAVSVKE